MSDPLSFMKPEQWMSLEGDCYNLAGMLFSAGSRRREDIATLSNAFTIMQGVLRQRPGEFGGPLTIGRFGTAMKHSGVVAE